MSVLWRLFGQKPVGIPAFAISLSLIIPWILRGYCLPPDGDAVGKPAGHTAKLLDVRPPPYSGTPGCPLLPAPPANLPETAAPPQPYPGVPSWLRSHRCGRTDSVSGCLPGHPTGRD